MCKQSTQRNVSTQEGGKKLSYLVYYGGESYKNLKYFLSRNLLDTFMGATEHHWRYDELIHDSYQVVQLFKPLLSGHFPSRWLQPLHCPLGSLQGVPDWVEGSMLQN